MTGLTSIILNYNNDIFIPLLTQNCHKLTTVHLDTNCTVGHILSLCHANPLLQELIYHGNGCITDTILIALIHACPHLHILYLPQQTNITDTGILALSERCLQLCHLNISNCDSITESAVQKLLQRCCKLTKLEVSICSLSKETWTQLDKNTQKRVTRC